MKSLRFTIGGKTAFFKIPEVNAVHYFTYGNLHKPALLGILGAIAGYDGYVQQKENGDVFPEYYEKLHSLKVSIVPLSKDGYFDKKIQNFNNSVGYASKEAGGNLIVSEQWLEDPAWAIYVLLDCDEAENLADRIVDGRCVYMPYLGKNDHPASIKDADVVEIKAATDEDIILDCLVPANIVDFDDRYSFRYQEYLPISLDKDINQHISEKFIKTDADLISCKEQIYEDDGTFIVFY